MERTKKIKIALGVTLFFLAVRFVLGFFPVPMEFVPYTGEPQKASLQEVYIVEIRHYMTTVDTMGDTMHYYEIKTPEGKVGLASSRTQYSNKTYEEPYRYIGQQCALMHIEQFDATYVDVFFETVKVEEPFLSTYGGDKQKAYAAVENLVVLNEIKDLKLEEAHPAAIWVAGCAFVSFCVMVAMLLKEYAGGRRKKGADEAEG